MREATEAFVVHNGTFNYLTSDEVRFLWVRSSCPSENMSNDNLFRKFAVDRKIT